VAVAGCVVVVLAVQLGGYLRAGLGPALVAQRDVAASPCDAGRLYAVIL
jgi:hypothetical protein